MIDENARVLGEAAHRNAKRWPTTRGNYPDSLSFEEDLAQMKQFFGVREQDLVWSDGKGWAVEEIQAITHTGTHVDAPYHYGPLSEGQAALQTAYQTRLERLK